MESEERIDTKQESTESPWPWLPDPRSVPAPLLQSPQEVVSDWISSGKLCDVCSKFAIPETRDLCFKHRTAKNLEQVAGAAIHAREGGCPLCVLIWKRMRDHFVYYCHDRSGGADTAWNKDNYHTNTFRSWEDREAWRDKGEEVDERARERRFSQLMSQNAENIELTKAMIGSTINIVHEASLDWGCIEASGSPLKPHQFGLRNSGRRTLTLFTFPDAPAARKVEHHIPWRNLPHAAQYASLWTRQCLKEHTMCSKSIESPLPKRLVDVGVYGSPDRPRIWINPSMASTSEGDATPIPITGTYMALSYCWGLEPFEVVNPENLASMTEGISVQRLPLTIQDAMEFTRLLGIRYLWVDSLCILQGESVEARTDWNEESVKMQTIYQNAFLTIGASVGNSANDGIRPPADPPEMRFCPLPKEFGRKEFPGQVYAGLQPTALRRDVIHTRAWTLQEFLLSTSYINLGNPKVYWYCKQSYWEQSVHLKPRSEVQSHPFLPPETGLLMFSHPEKPYMEWQQIVQYYTSRSISKTEDRLIALSGIANDFWLRRNKQDEYLVGLWKSTITFDLLWSIGQRPYLPLDPTLPSWSWASQQTSITYWHTEYRKVCSPDCAQFLGSHVAGDSARSAKRSIRLNGWIKKALFKPGVDGTDGNLSENENTPFPYRHVKLDRPMDEERQPSITLSNEQYFEVLCLELHRSDSGLLLLPESLGSNRFVRVGTFYEYESPTDFFSGERCDVELV